MRHTLWQTLRVCQSFLEIHLALHNSKFKMRHTLWQTLRVCQSFLKYTLHSHNSKFVRHTLWQTLRVCQSFLEYTLHSTIQNSKFKMRHTLWQTLRVCQSFLEIHLALPQFKIRAPHTLANFKSLPKFFRNTPRTLTIQNSKFKIQISLFQKYAKYDYYLRYRPYFLRLLNL